jgi:HEAT repeat protein
MEGEAMPSRDREWLGKRLALCGVLLFLAAEGCPAFDAKSASPRDLYRRMQRYGSTEQRRAEKKAAKAEFIARGGESVRFLMDHIHLKNMWVRIYLTEYVEQGRFKEEDAVPVLLEYLTNDRSETRKRAAYYLGFYDTPQHAGAVQALLGDEKATGAAARTLGKWGVAEAIEEIGALFGHEKEIWRVIAANALRDIGDARAAPFLVDALKDPVCTVRKTASRALAALGEETARALLEDLPAAEGPALRELIHVLGAVKCRKAIRPLRRLLEHPDPGVARDAASALHAIDPEDAEDWIEDTPAAGAVRVGEEGVFVRVTF